MYRIFEYSFFWAMVIISLLTIGALVAAGYVDISLIDEAWEVAQHIN